MNAYERFEDEDIEDSDVILELEDRELTLPLGWENLELVNYIIETTGAKATPVTKE